MKNKFKIKGDMVEIYIISPKYGKKIVKIDIHNLALIEKYKWHIKKDGCNFYAHNSNPSLLMHRLIMGYPEGKVIDHIDNNGLNNLELNLRVCTRLENGRNKRNSANRMNTHA
jgi:hypothetical protein